MSYKITVIILNFNGLDNTRECLNSVLKTNYQDFRVIVADNGSSENEAEVLVREFKDRRLNFLRFNKNWGFAEGVNRIIRKSVKSGFVALLNNDAVVDPQWLSEMVRLADSDKKIAAVQAKIRSYYRRDYFDPSGCGGFLDVFGFPYTKGRIGFYVERDEGQYDDTMDIFWASGCCLLLRYEVIQKMGLISKEYFFYHEETDLCWRLKDLGFRIVCASKAVVYHKGGATSLKNVSKRIYYVHRNNLLLLAQNLSIRKVFWVIPARFFLDWAIGFHYLITKKPHFFLSLIVGQMSFIAMLPLIFRNRHSRKGDWKAETEMKPLSILWEYFIHRVRRYSELHGKFTKIPVISNYYIGKPVSK